jgi:hypothetical protein
LVWGRDVSEAASRSFADLVGAKFLITGHIACDAGYEFPNPIHLIVDCSGAPATCVLLPITEEPTRQTVQAGLRRLG